MQFCYLHFILEIIFNLKLLKLKFKIEKHSRKKKGLIEEKQSTKEESLNILLLNKKKTCNREDNYFKRTNKDKS